MNRWQRDKSEDILPRKTWRVLDKLKDSKEIEEHAKYEDAYRALLILTAHEIRNDQAAHFIIEPEMIQAASPSLEYLKLPKWAYEVYTLDIDELHDPNDFVITETRDGVRPSELVVKAREPK